MATNIGNTEAETANTRNINDTIAAIKITTTEAGTLNSISAYVSTEVANKTGVLTKCALYTADGVFVAETEEIDLNAADTNPHWQTYDFSIGQSLTTATDYWLAIWGKPGEGATYPRIMAGAPDTVSDEFISQTYAASWPTPLAPTGTSYHYAIYGTYTAGGGGATPLEANLSDSLIYG